MVEAVDKPFDTSAWVLSLFEAEHWFQEEPDQIRDIIRGSNPGCLSHVRERPQFSRMSTDECKHGLTIPKSHTCVPKVQLGKEYTIPLAASS